MPKRTESNLPIIGINCISIRDSKASSPTSFQQFEISRAYNRSVELAGGVPVVLPLLSNKKIIEKTLDLIDGLILSGGG